MKRRDFLRQATLGAAGAAGWLGLAWPAWAGALPPDPFYAHTFSDTQGGQVEFAAYLGRPLVLNFWATWCPPCVKEMPDLDALHKKHGHVQFVGLAVDTAANVQKFGEKVQVSYPLLIAGHGGIKLMRGLGNKNGGLPFTVVFDEKGRVSTQMLGQIKPDELDRYLANMG
ncbi:TlpA disulfide reductase family protein [Pusillimonas sp. SM2304]|uniref:TlpA family protein disulfide reductase n=1 Tax=Pusillimonas sp. SM2304 TaxID=3073241 RepID=UPI0028765998|nr:TlpA disulfide reductase family protein [Pusillimonas sp. SM2304]MDS1140360.1 TlpA disulfide reductase family protein [Pusillimonas sp. SM2304]